MKLKEDVAVNNAGGGYVDGIGVGDKGEPGVRPKKKKLRKFRDVISSTLQQK